MQVVYEDNHIIVVNKEPGEIVQGDKTGDETLADNVRRYIKERYNKPGNVFLGVVHRLDRPVAGLVIFARTSKALARLNRMFAEGEVHKTYWAITPLGRQTVPPPNSPMLITHWLTRNEKQNKSYAHDHETPGAKKAQLRLAQRAQGERYQLLEIQLLTGRHHQIRCQLAAIGLPIKGDLKYGAPRSNNDGSISLLAHTITFTHPVTKLPMTLTAPMPNNDIWKTIAPETTR